MSYFSNSKFRGYHLAIALTLLGSVMIGGCGGEDDPVNPGSSGAGTIQINQTPEDLADAGWTLTGPQNETSSGTQTLAGRAVGNYTLTWNNVSGYVTPTDTTQTLTANATVTFTGTYEVAEALGTIRIVQTPGDLADAGWALTGPQNETGSGNILLTEMPVGEYTLTWNDVSGFITPFNPATTLETNATMIFRGEYLVEGSVGTIQINQTPVDLEGAAWQLSGPRYQMGSGSVTLTDMPLGFYTLAWSDVSAYIPPTTSTLSLAVIDTTVTFTGTYTSYFRLVPARTYYMGSSPTELGHYPNETRHSVNVSHGVYVSRFEVTEEWWDYVMGSGSSTSKLPKTYVTWDEAVAFCNQLSLNEGRTPAYTINGPNGDVTWDREADGYRLPTEAEWENACRGGNGGAFCNGAISNTLCSDPNLNEVGWFCGNSGAASHRVGLKTANNVGLFDMHGNVYEWVWDGYIADYESLPQVDPVQDVDPGADRVFRGGGWYDEAQVCRSAYRTSGSPETSVFYIGFRPVRTNF